VSAGLREIMNDARELVRAMRRADEYLGSYPFEVRRRVRRLEAALDAFDGRPLEERLAASIQHAVRGSR